MRGLSASGAMPVKNATSRIHGCQFALNFGWGLGDVQRSYPSSAGAYFERRRYWTLRNARSRIGTWQVCRATFFKNCARGPSANAGCEGYSGEIAARSGASSRPSDCRLPWAVSVPAGCLDAGSHRNEGAVHDLHCWTACRSKITRKLAQSTATRTQETRAHG